MTLFDKPDHTVTLTFVHGNGIKVYQDFVYYYTDIPHGIPFEVSGSDYDETIWLSGPGYGAKDNYGNGRLALPASDAPTWLFEQLGIKRNRREGERRGR